MALPIEFVSRTKALLGETEYNLLEAALQTEPPVSIRLNERKLPGYTPLAAPVPWSRSGYYLPRRLPFTFDPLFHAGAYYVQEASSMFLEQAVRQYVDGPVRCLDLCAAPGGKSTHLLSVLPEGSLLVSNEVIRSRSNILAENLAKWGHPASIVTNNDPEETGRLTHFFDLIVTDVPCSGEGMFRKDTDSTGEWSEANVRLCAARQRRILHDVWDALVPGGLLVYSTCTYNTEEDEDNVRYIATELGAEVLPLAVPEEWNVTGALKHDLPVSRFFPHKTRGEGFFLAVLRKDEGDIAELKPRKKGRKEKGKAPAVPAVVKDRLLHPEEYEIEMRGDAIQAFPRRHYEAYQLIAEHLRIVQAGIRPGEVKGKDLLPAHALALSSALNPAAFPRAEVTWDEAIRYLRKEALTLPPEQPRGYVLLTFRGLPLGFVKNLGNRSNNLYPQEWRIRSSYLPTDPLPSILP